MPITALDIKLRKSQRLTDNPDGGGRMVAAEIVDGEMNNLFPDIGDEERTTGRSTLRKMFVHVDTADTDVLKDAIGIIINPPMDSHVSMSMFATGSYSDVREQAKNRVEGYITKGVESRFVLFGNHFIGQMAINLYCMQDAATPEVNDNLCLGTNEPGYDQHEQYIRVKSILARTTETFYDDAGAFQRDVIILETVNALLYDFYGQEANRRTSIKPPSRVYETNTVDAASYYSVKRLVVAGEVGDLSVKVDSPYVPIVPSTQAETPVVDVLAGMGTVSYVQAGATDALALSYSIAFAAGVPLTRFLGSPFTRGSVKVNAGSVELTDDGAGNLTVGTGTSPWHGNVDYAGGSVSVIHDAGIGSTSVSILATPAGQIIDQGYTQKIDITTGNQGYNYLFSLSPLPAAGTVVVDYRALGKWIRLIDNGTGQLVGKPGQGSGTINYATGSVVLTAGALPDVDSAVLCSYGTGVVSDRRDGDALIEPPKLNFLLGHAGVKPGTVELTWIVSSSPVVATDDGEGLLLVGATEVGTIAYSSGEVNLQLTTLPDANSLISSEYDWSAAHASNLTPIPDGSGIVSFTLPDVPVRAGSLGLEWLTSVRPTNNEELGATAQAVRFIAMDDGLGNIIGGPLAAKVMSTLGTISYTTGAISVQVGGLTIGKVSFPVYGKDISRGEFWRVRGSTRAAGNATFSAGTLLVVAWQDAASGATTVTDEFELPPVELDLTPDIIDAVVPGSVRFTYKGRTYVDRAGSLYYGIDPVSGAGTYAGSMDYASGYAVITGWAAGGTNAVSIHSLLSRMSEPGTDALYFRTPGSPLRPGAFTIRATTLDGDQITATSDISGNITGDLIEGTVDWDSGVVKVRFGEMVTAAGNEGEPWYDVGSVVGANVWRPMLMIPSSIFFNTVVYRSIPLSPVVVGLDPGRLPSDGRVPAFKPGQTVLIHHTEVIDVASPTAGQLVDFGRDRIAQIEVRDDDGVPVLSSWYTVDLDVGELEFSDPLNLSAYKLPIHISHRIDDRRLVSAVQITGEIEINTALSHDFPVTETMISTALRLGEANGSLDLQARVQGLFDQGTWSDVWQDTLIGSGAPGTYNDTDFPLVVTNADAITERWALRFTSSSAFEVIGETVGTIGSGTTGVDCAPLNPRTGEPYFVIDKDGWGAGWATGNALRFNTIGGLAPVWMVRTTLAGAPEEVVDSFRFQVVGNSAGVTP